MNYYHYVDNEKMHILVSDEISIIEKIKQHWDEGKIIPYKWVRNDKADINMDKLEELKRIRDHFKLLPTTEYHPRFSI